MSILEEPIIITKYSDFTWPFCYVATVGGTPVLEKDPDIQIEWVSWEGRPPEKPFAPYTTEKKLELYNTKFKPLADKYNVPINPPEKNCRTTNAHLATIYSREKGKLKEYRNRIYKARWVEDLDIGNPNILIQLAEEIGLESKEIENVINEKRYLSVLHSQRAQGKSIGIFGIPSFVIRGKIFWGVDVIEELKEEIAIVKRKLIEEQEKED